MLGCFGVRRNDYTHIVLFRYLGDIRRVSSHVLRGEKETQFMLPHSKFAEQGVCPESMSVSWLLCCGHSEVPEHDA